ncbi:MAG: site-specific integrase [bacterium]|nr:site-specific integrase [bacterium]
MSKKANGQGSVRKKNRKDRVYWEGRYTNEEGKQKSIYRDTEAECKKALKEAIAEAELKKKLKEKDLAYNPDVILNEWAEICFSRLLTNLKPQTISNYRRIYKYYWNERLGQKKIKEVSRIEIQTIINQKAEQGNTHSTIRTAIIILSKIYNLAIMEHLIEKTPVDKVNLKLGKEKTEKFALTDEQIQQLLQAMSSNRSKHYILAVLILLNTGLRAGEILAITWADFIDDFKFVHITKTVVNNKNLSTPKNEYSRRFVPIHPEMRKIITKYKERLIESGTYLEHAPIICNCFKKKWEKKDGFLTVSYFNKWLSRLCISIQKEHPDFPDISSHYFRHTFASRAVKYGMPLIYLQKICGWSSMDMINKVYVHTEFEQMSMAMNQMYEKQITQNLLGNC